MSSGSCVRQSAAWCFVAVFLLAVAGCKRPPTAERLPPADAGWKLAVEPIPSPASGTTTAPQLTVNGDRTILSWLETADARTTLKFAERTSSGWSGASRRGIRNGLRHECRGRALYARWVTARSPRTGTDSTATTPRRTRCCCRGPRMAGVSGRSRRHRITTRRKHSTVSARCSRRRVPRSA